MFNKKNDPLIESVKGVMEQNELHRRVEAAVNEHFGIESRSALPHELHAEYDAVLAEAKKCSIEEGEVIDLAAKRKEKAKKKEEESDEGKIRKYVTALAGPKQAKKIMKKRDDDELNEEKKDGAKYKKNIHKQTGDKIKGYKEKDDGKSITRQWTVERPKKKKKLEESEDKPDSPEHHRAMAIRAHKAMKAGDRSEITANKKKRHEKAYKEMTGSKIKYPDSMNEENDEGSSPRNAKERALAKLHGNRKKITHGDVLKGRGVVEEDFDQLDEKEMSSSEKKKEKKLKAKYDPSGMKKSMINQYGKEKGKQIYFAKIRKEAMNESLDIILEEIYTNLLEELNYVYENYDEASFADYVNLLSEEQLEILGLNEKTEDMTGRNFGAENQAARRSGPSGPPQNPNPGTGVAKPGIVDTIKSMVGVGGPDYSKAPNTSSMKAPTANAPGQSTTGLASKDGSVAKAGPSQSDLTSTEQETSRKAQTASMGQTTTQTPSTAAKSPDFGSRANSGKTALTAADTASRFGKGGPGGARAKPDALGAGDRMKVQQQVRDKMASGVTSNKVGGIGKKVNQMSDAQLRKSAGMSVPGNQTSTTSSPTSRARQTPTAVKAARNVRTGTPPNRSGAARPTRPGATRPVRSGAPRTTAAQDFMNNFQREEYEKPQIKESFEQFLRNRFLKG